MNSKNLRIGMFFMFAILLISFGSSYTRTIGSGDQYRGASGIGGFGGGDSLQFDKSMCEDGTDFLMQLTPFGCDPPVVRSDLLEEQDVTVFCQIGATQINPLIQVEAIDRIEINPDGLSEGVRSIGYHPASSALGYLGDVQAGKLNNPILKNLGYVTITLKRNPNESSMPDFVEGNLSAKLRYDVKNAFGVGQASFYLPVLTDEEWEDNLLKYSFWQGRGYLRADGVGANTATVSLYSDNEIATSGLSSRQGRGYAKQKFTSFNLIKGEKSQEIYLPGFSMCLASLSLRLDGLENPDTMARLKVNDDVYEVKRGEKFLNNKCYITGNFKKQGLNQRISVFCREDEGKSSRFDLAISPSVNLEIGGIEGSYTAGDFLYKNEDGTKAVYLGYVGSVGKTTKIEDLYVVLIALPYFQDKLSDSQVSSIATHTNYILSETETGAKFFDNVVDGLSKITGFAIEGIKYVVNGQDFEVVPFKKSSGVISTTNVFGKEVLLGGFSEAGENEFMKVVEERYSIEDEVDEIGFIKNEAGENTGLYLEDHSTDSSKINLKPLILTQSLNPSIGTFNGEDCVDGLCDKYVLSSISNFGQEGLFEGFFDNMIGAELIGDEIIVKRIVFQDFDVSGEHESHYKKAMNDFETLVNSFAGELMSSGESYGERALYEAILLAENVNQKKTMTDLCDEFKNKYPSSNKNLEGCYDEFLVSNSEVSTNDVLIDRYLRRISFEGIYEPTFRNYGAKVLVKGPSGKSEEFQLTKDNPVYLTGLRDAEATYIVNNIDEPLLYIRYKARWYWSLDNVVWMDMVTKKVRGTNELLKKESLAVVSELNKLNEANGETFLDGFGAEKRLEEIETEFIELVDLTENTADIKMHVAGEHILTQAFVTDTSRLELGKIKGFNSGYVFTVTDINLNQVAKVSVIPNINYAQSEAEFGFKVGIEKRAIQLSPERIDAKITALNSSIEDWQKAYDALKGINTGLKTACLGLGAGLTLKNLITNSGGKTIARQEVMQGKGGFNEICQGEVAAGQYNSMDSCYLDKSEDIDREVNEYYKIMQKQEEGINVIEDKYTEEGGFLGNDYIKEDEFATEYSQKVSGELYDLGDEEINIDDMETIISEGWGDNIYSVDDLRDIEFYSMVLDANPRDEKARERLSSLYTDIQINSNNLVGRKTLATELEIDSSSIGFIELGTGQKEKLSYLGEKTNDDKIKIEGVPKGTPVHIFKGSDSKNYILVLDNSAGTSNLPIKTDDSGKMVYDIEGNRIFNKDPDSDILLNKDLFYTLGKISFIKYDETSYKNEYKNPEIRYYETEPYKGMPSVVPVDTKNGWYAYVKQTLPVGGNIRLYDDSGVIRSFYLCNVGENKLEESLGGDDICQLFNLRGTGKQDYNSFYGLKEGEVSNLVVKAVNAIEEVERAYGAGVRNVNIDGRTFKVGNPAVNTPIVQCQDFMSPKECNLLFNVCDPVICPSSRCNLGGNYPVRDVIQSGIIGSVALCLPNFPEVKVPICLSGIQAGIDGWNSVQTSYRDCLQTNLDTGETIGICDEIHSVYMCEFFWRQSLPIVQLALPKIISAAFGENVRGGGEYLGVQSAWDNARDSIQYFTQYYAANSNRAFKARSIDEAGGAVCKSFISATYPGSGSFLDRLTEPDSPTQFYGQFDEIPMTTATNPPTSHYKVFYHIYSGRDTGAYYSVYLRSTGSSFYQDTAFRRNVASDYIPVGEFATETVDFTAPSGYNELCINVNGQEECGFKQVTTSFAVDYMTELYVASQADETDVKTEAECISGSSSLSSLLLNPNIQAGAEEVINPAIYDRGIIRICATNDPGVGTDALAGQEGSRWKQVGICGDNKLKCWLDSDSVKDVIKATNIEERVLDDVSDSFLEELRKSEGYISSEEVERRINEIDSSGKTDLEKISLIDELIDSVFYNNQKAKVLFLRGTIYSGLAKKEYVEIKKRIKEEEEEAEKKGLDIPDGPACDNLIDVLAELQGIGDARKRVLKAAEIYENQLAYIGEERCFGAVEFIYEKAGVDTNCIYSDKEGKFYSTSYGDITINNKGGPYSSSNPALCTMNKQNPNIDTEQKLNNIKEGDLLSIVANADLGHNVIFINWIDEGSRNANVFDWNGVDVDGNKIYRYAETTLSDEEHAVYQYWAPEVEEVPECTVNAECPAGSDCIDNVCIVGELITPPEVEILDGESPLFGIVFRSSSGKSGLLNLVFSSNDWYWQIIETSIPATEYDVSSITFESGWIETDLNKIESDFHKSDSYERLDDNFKELIQTMDSKTYPKGLRLLNDFALRNYILVTENVYSPLGQPYFEFRRDNGDLINFEYNNVSGWLFKPLDLDRNLDWIKVNDKVMEQKGTSYEIKEGSSVKYRGDIEDFDSFNKTISGFEGRDYDNGIIYLFSQNPNFGKISIYSSAQFLTQDIDVVINYLKDRFNEGKISDISVLIRQLSEVDQIDEEELSFLLGEDENNLEAFPEDMEYIIDLLEFKRNLFSLCSQPVGLQCYINYLDETFGNTERYTTFIQNRIFIDFLYTHGVINEKEYKSLLPSFVGRGLYGVGKFFGLNPEKGGTMQDLKEILENK